jgi:hypothetical protein
VVAKTDQCRLQLSAASCIVLTTTIFAAGCSARPGQSAGKDADASVSPWTSSNLRAYALGGDVR